MIDERCRNVTYDPELHKWHKQFMIWDEWTKSEEYAKAFRVYYKAGSVPLNRYPPCLVRKNEDKGTVSVAHLDGTHEWRDFQDEDFLSTAIYNEQLAKWRKRFEKKEVGSKSVPVRGRKSIKSSGVFLSFPLVQIAGWVLAIILLFNFPNNALYANNAVYYGLGYVVATVLLTASIFLARYPLTRLLHIEGVIFSIGCALVFLGIVTDPWVLGLIFPTLCAIVFTALATAVWFFLRFLENGISMFKR